MSTEQESTIENGMDVVDIDGDKVGSVDHLVGDHIAVARGWLYPTDYLVPLSEIAAVDDKVHLNVTSDQALARGFEPVAGRGSAQEVLDNDDPVDSIGMPGV
ncbi:MAG TPA: DUF2171 domain-containing protein [Thermomicrobiales bacterium]|nr:DUF2171 domain-containing protein [Thermomicrobiales bacterium]